MFTLLIHCWYVLLIMLVIRDGTVTQVSDTLVCGTGWEDTGGNNGITGVF